MVQLLRLRQCTSHPFMLEKTIRESWTLEDVAELRATLAKFSRNTTPFYEQCQLVRLSNIPRKSCDRREKRRGWNVQLQCTNLKPPPFQTQLVNCANKFSGSRNLLKTAKKPAMSPTGTNTMRPPTNSSPLAKVLSAINSRSTRLSSLSPKRISSTASPAQSAQTSPQSP